MITTSEIKISVLVSRDESQQALRIVHRAFGLEGNPEASSEEPSAQDGPVKPGLIPLRKMATKSELPSVGNGSEAAAVVSRLQSMNMEDLTIDEVSLDGTQARVTISGVPDKPGIAAKVFEDVAAAGVFVDMIVQSHPSAGGAATLSFTVPQNQLNKSVDAARRIAQNLGCKAVSSSPIIAKLSVSGVGLRTHTGVAIRMFKALADAGINLEMINTSEVRVNVVVDGLAGEKGLNQLQAAFADVLR
jgi:aspartate kinase